MGDWVDALATPQHTHMCTHTLFIYSNIPPSTCHGCVGCYSRTEACFQPCDSAGLIKEHISICSHSASAQCLPIKHTRCTHTKCTMNHTHFSSCVSLCHQWRDKLTWQWSVGRDRSVCSDLRTWSGLWPSCFMAWLMGYRWGLTLVSRSHERIWSHCRQVAHMCVCLSAHGDIWSQRSTCILNNSFSQQGTLALTAI